MADSELSAVEAALQTLALAETESALQKVVTRLLPALLSALSTKSEAARSKCVQALHHINVRIRSHPQIVLPFNEVLRAAISPTSSIMTTNVAIQGGYLSRCLYRLQQPEKAAAFPSLIDAALSVSSKANKEALHHLAFYALSAAVSEHPASSRDKLLEKLQCQEAPLAEFFSFALLALRGKLKKTVQESFLLATIRLASEFAGLNQPVRAAKVFPHFLVAAGTGSSTALVTAGEDAMRHIDSCDTLAASDPTITELLFDLFNDTLAEIPLRIVVLAKGLLRVSLCASCFPEVFHVFQNSIFTPGIPARFQALGMQFVTFVITNCDAAVLEENSKEFVRLLMRLLKNDTADGSLVADKLRGFGYIALSDLAVHVPNLLQSGAISVELFFAAVQSKDLSEEIKVAAAQALVTLTRVVRFELNDTSQFRSLVLTTLRKTVLDQEMVSSSAKAAAVQWANDCFSFSDPEARLINIIAASDSRLDIRQLSKAGLSSMKWRKGDRLGKKSESSDIIYPSLQSILRVFEGHQSENALLPDSLSAYLRFALSCLKVQISPQGKPDLLSTGGIEPFLSRQESVLEYVKKLLKTAQESILFVSSNKQSNLERAALSVILFASKATALRTEIACTSTVSVDELLLRSIRRSAQGDTVMVQALSALIGILSVALSPDQVQQTLERIGTGLEIDSSGDASGKQGEDQRSAKIFAVGQIVSHSANRPEVSWDDSETLPISKVVLHISRRVALSAESSDVVRIAACYALADIGAVRHLPLLLKSRQKLLSDLTNILKLTSSSPGLVQAAASTLGKICVGEPRLSFKRKACEGLIFVCRERKEEDVRFSVSESLVRCASSFDAPSPTTRNEGNNVSRSVGLVTETEELRDIMYLRSSGFSIMETINDEATEECGIIADIIRQIISFSVDERPNARAGGCVCLFTFLRLLTRNHSSASGSDGDYGFASSPDEIRYEKERSSLLQLLPEIQQSFVLLLSDRSDFVQQLASCGVALVYNICPEKGQQELVSTLVRSLTSSRKAAGTVPGDKGTLLELSGVNTNEVSSGSRSATYKELCSLAQDMGKPELLYKFMDLAGHAAIWNSRKGAALAGSELLNSEFAAEQLRPHVKGLLPRLYVYCFDPTESVRVAMTSVISAVIKASGHNSVAAAITANFSLVSEHCLKSMRARQWRAREAGCGALRDAMISRTWPEVKHLIKEFWYFTLRAMDDIKGSVRKAAQGTGRALSELSVHLCDPGFVGEENAGEAVPLVLSVLLPAFTHSADEVRMLASKAISEIIRGGGSALRSSVPDLISSLLEAATELEPQVLNYAEYHIDSPEELRDARVKAASTSSSSVIECLERLTAQVDETSVEEVVARLVRLARMGVGIPTRAATARLFSSLVYSRAIILESHAAKLMFAAAGAAGMERNEILRKSWCNAAGSASRLSQTEEVAKYTNRIAKKAESENPRDRDLASSLAAGLWRKAPETARQHASTILPWAYVGRQEADEEAGKASMNWEEVWSDGAPSTQAGLRLYWKEIMNICEDRLLSSAQYRVKRSAAATIGDLARASNGMMEIGYLSRSAKLLLKVLPGRIWEGQIVAIEALGYLAASCSDGSVWHESGGSTEVVRLLVRESHRGKKEYRIAAIRAAVEALIKTRNDIDMFAEVRSELSDLWALKGVDGNEGVSNISRTVWETGSDADAVDARNKARKARKLLCKAAIQCLESSFPEKERQERQLEHIGDLLNVFEEVGRGDWDVKLSMLECLLSVTSRLSTTVLADFHADGEGSNLHRIARLSRIGVLEAKYDSLKKCGLEIAGELATLIKDDQVVTRALGEDAVRQIVMCEGDDIDPGVQSAAKKLRTLLSLRKNA